MKGEIDIMMLITFFIVGVLSAVGAWLLIRLAQQQQIKMWQLAGLALGIALILFCIAWGIASVLEGVPRAAAMGVVFFGFPGVVLLTVIGRQVMTGSMKQE